MSDQLLPLYDQELAYLRQLAGEFADAHPKIAGRLRLSADAVDDPHVARLIEGFALIAARIRQKLDDEFPELTDSLLGALYPHMLAPFPSAAIARFSPLPDLDGAYRVARHTALEMEPIGGEACRYRTTQEVELWPIRVVSAELGGRPLVAPAGPHSARASASLRLVLECLSPGQTFTNLGIDRLRFFLHGLPQHAAGLYELLCNDLLGVALADHPEDQRAVHLSPDAVTAGGFAADEGLLPYSARSLDAYRLLGEYFSFPQKFLFFDLSSISAKALHHAGARLEVFFYLDRTVPGLDRQVGAESFQLGCTPIVNLFAQRAEPVALTHEHAEYQVVPDSRRHATREVFSVDRVTLAEAGRGSRAVVPYFASHHAADPDRQTLFWATQRRRLGERDDSTDTTLSIVDTELNPASPTDGILAIETTCLNRDLPRQIPYGGNRPQVGMVDGAAEVTGVRCVTPPTATLRPAGGRRSGWRLASQLSLNHLSLCDGEDGAQALREILRLHDLRDVPETRAAIESIRSVTTARGTARLPGSGAICRGIDVTLELDARRLEGTGAFLFASVVERFLGLYASLNSFTRLTVRLHGREEVLRAFPPRAGDRPLL
jgi:type VI secretion system protein ImpG